MGGWPRPIWCVLTNEEPGPARRDRFGSGEYRAFFRNSQKFDNAMIGFLDCLNQLITYAKAADSTFKIPFE